MSKMLVLFSTCILLMSMSLIFMPVSHAQGLSSKQATLYQQNPKDTNTQASGKLNNSKETKANDTATLFANSKVNQYIIDNHLEHSPVVKDPRMDTLPKLEYKNGTYMGVVIHEVGEDNRPLQVWVDRMYETYTRAFVHAFVDNNEIHLTAPAEYYVWGAGPKANPYFYQIELVRMYNFEDFAKSVNNQAWLAAYMLKQNGITPTLADDNAGKGSVISHNAVGKYWGGTDHVDPIEYYGRWGYDMHQMFDLIKYYYDNMA
ncbi:MULTISPECIES: peptidoglycan recognition protein family protein [Staphylococcus]|uniref:peptidoglycan recognition protein family protein n=1 Tax=Staphylococcus TaxID=1279 RepID=UPI00045A0E2A|nr:MULTISPECIES: N-acetylmuramoyl-L-alanine amidase [Staphylococcus]AMG64846.1 autolysin [Staphylococcus lugdunensis]ARJ27989.1 autolysin [Staphylococcus lugdunensis]KAK57084.1 N-acetylmuramoyl-L-alanine amidase [Staphylococcus lugdunensis VCU150]MCH8673096.1 N-acetylmuramoyl-L-alanine amidase [Staphylococcus lugdunensis]MCH8674435.1 N-acetylmuramoyl-L-alanine amidase [Staphylococcus lugdunensis]